jgi:beta-mannanase
VLTWEPKDWRYGKYQPDFSLRAISSGKHDDYIRGYARRVKGWGRLIHIRLMHEMNGDWYPWGTNLNGNKPAHFKSAWTRVVDIFRQEQASNVRWVWCPNVERPVWNAPHPMSSYYPGHNYVDWVGLDGYNYAGSRSMPWYSFREILGSSYEEISALAPTKPLMLVETASDESGGDKASWISSIKGDLQYRFPKVSALIWFNQDEGLSRLTIDSSLGTLEAFRLFAHDLYLRGALSR